MLTNSLVKILNVSLRGITLASKFIFIFYFAKFIEPVEFGLFGLFSAIIVFALYFVGFDFYIFTTREILKEEHNAYGGVIKHHCVILIVLYVISIPLLSLVFFNGILPWRVSGWFILLLILEHLSQEVSRILNSISKQLLSTLILFFRSGIWSIAITILMFFDVHARNLNYILGSWVIGDILALSIGGYYLYSINISGWSQKLDFNWILTGLKISFPFLLATLASRCVFTLDKYWFGSLTGLDVLAAYVLFMSICNTLITFLDASVISFSYPVLIRAWQRKDFATYSQSVRKLLFQTVLICILFSLSSIVCINYLLIWINKFSYMKNKDLFYLILMAMVFYALSMIPHYALYAQGKDNQIIYSEILGGILFFPVTYTFSLYWPGFAVPLGLCITFFIILFWKTLAYLKLTPPEYL